MNGGFVQQAHMCGKYNVLFDGRLGILAHACNSCSNFSCLFVGRFFWLSSPGSWKTELGFTGVEVGLGEIVVGDFVGNESRRLFAQGTVEVKGGADEGKMRKGLREISKGFAMLAGFFRIQA